LSIDEEDEPEEDEVEDAKLPIIEEEDDGGMEDVD